jgi:hypothetical protein
VYAAVESGGEDEGVIAVDEDTLAATIHPLPLFGPSAFAVDPLAQRLTILHGSTDFYQIDSFDAATFAAIGSPVTPNAGDYGGVLSADPVFDRVWFLAGEDGCGIAGALDAGVGALPDTHFLGCGSAIANPATRFAHAVREYGDDQGPYGFATKDLDETTPQTEFPLADDIVPLLPGNPPILAVNVAESRVYFAGLEGGAGVVFAVDEPRRAPVPITTTLWNEPPQPDGTVVVHTSAATAWPLPVSGVYWQADAIDGAWTAATPAGAAGTATVALAPGAHEIHAFAVDGQEATLGELQRRSPIVGPTTTLPVYVATPQPHVDVELDSPWTDRSLPRPGAFPFQLSLVNATGGPQTFAFLISLQVPGFGSVTLLPATGMQIPNSVGFAAAVHLPVSDFLPAGTYTLGVVVLQAGVGIVDQSVMTFSVE